MAYIGKTPTIGNFQVCDAISVVNGQAAYTMQVGSVNVSPETANHMLVSLNGVLQAPGSSYTVSGSTITFASNLVTGDVINFIHILGSVLDLGVPSNDTVGAAQIKDDLISGTTALASEPADTDEFLVSDAGTLKRIDYSLIKGGGKILQVIMASDSSQRSTSSTSFGTHSHTCSVDITPSATSSKILCLYTTNTHYDQGGSGALSIFRDSTNLGGSTHGLIWVGPDAGGLSATINHLDSPSSTSQITYSIQFKATSGGGNIYVGRNANLSQLTCLEIGA
jgi:hypothetical protein